VLPEKPDKQIVSREYTDWTRAVYIVL